VETASLHAVVLIVEDDCLVRMSVADSTRQVGFVVLEAENADEALQLLKANPDVAIVFTDVQMPGSMDGLALANAVKSRWPPINIVVTSGRRGLAKDDLPPDTLFFPKPYAFSEITETFLKLAKRFGRGQKSDRPPHAASR
jgi:DNA-binding NtrC family response regulator